MVAATLKNLIRPTQAFKLLRRGIEKSFSKHLLATNVAISISLSATGDLMQQYYRINIREQKSWDKLRTRNMTCTGATVGVLCHHWYQVLDRRFPGRCTRAVFKKLTLDQLIFSPVCILVFISTLSFLRGFNQYVENLDKKDDNNFEIFHKRFCQFKEDLSIKGLKLYLADWVVWPPAQLINFYFLPTKYRVLYDNTISLLYDVYTSHVMYSKEQGVYREGNDFEGKSDGMDSSGFEERWGIYF